MHNQNDVGSVIVHVNGESVVADIGRGRYTRAYFGPERYEHLVNSSLGHSVPVPNGKEQQPGRDHAASLLAHRAESDNDLMMIEMRDAYPEAADLDSLRRTVRLDRASPRGKVELTDEVRFATGPGSFESVLTTFGQVEIRSGVVSLVGDRGALRVTFDDNAIAARVEEVADVDLAEGPADVRRVIFALRKAAPSATVRLGMEPA
jgi:hypothetical protein